MFVHFGLLKDYLYICKRYKYIKSVIPSSYRNFKQENLTMRKLLLFAVASLATVSIFAETNDIIIDGQVYPVDTLIERQVGPGTVYRRLRIPTYPLNINMLEVDVTNPNVRIETTQANEKLFGTETLVNAASRQNAEGHRPFAGANGNFWCVTTSYPYSDYLIGTTFNANLRNGKIITETNCAANQWDRGPEYIGELGVTPDGKVYSDPFRWVGTFKSEKTGIQNIEGANKLVHANEIVMFNSYYGESNTMKCADMVWREQYSRWGFDLVHESATEVYLKLIDGEKWTAGKDIRFEVVKTEDNTDMGTPGSFDLVLVGRDSRRDALRKLEAGDIITLNYAWTTLAGEPIEFDNMIGGNGQVMIDGELTELNTLSENCALVYSKTGYGTSADHNKLYIIVIDKSTDPKYGVSAGCTSAVMCQIAKHYGCSNLTNFDSGGSAMLYVTDKIVNKTTESTPRAVANGMMIYSTSPDDHTIARLEFADRAIRVPTYAAIAPTILGYNRYDYLESQDVEGIKYSTQDNIGEPSTDGTRFVAGNTAGTGIVTASLGDIYVSTKIEVVESDFSFWVPELVIDQIAETILFRSVVDDSEFIYKPENVTWDITPLDDDTKNPMIIDEEGKVVATSEGKALVTATIKDRQAFVLISAELHTDANEPLEKGEIDPSEWTFTKSGSSTPTMTPTHGNTAFDVDFNVTSTRGARVVAAKNIRLHSTPKFIYANIDTGDKQLSSVVVTIIPANSKQDSSITMEKVEGTENLYVAQLWDGERDISIFPITFKSIQFTPTTSGQHHISVKSLETGFDVIDGVTNIVPDESNPAGQEIFYDMRGIRIDPANASPGLYIVRDNNNTKKILKK